MNTVKRLRPEVAIIAVMETKSQATFDFSSVFSELANVGVKFELLTTDIYNVGDDPNLHTW